MQISQGAQSKRAQAVQQLRQALSTQKNEEAMKVIKDLPPKLREDPEVLFLEAVACERLNLRDRAIVAAEKSVKKFPHGETMVLLARCHRTKGNTDEAIRWCDKAEEKLPGKSIMLKTLRGGAMEEAGRFAEATAMLEPLVDAAHEAGRPLEPGLRVEWSKLLVQNKRLDEAVEMISGTLENDNLPEIARIAQLHLKAKACDRNKDFPAAWEAAERANEINRIEFSPEIYKDQVDTLIRNWSRENMQKFPVSQCDSELPVFVAGMPRSGTSLIDQIIDAHPKASGVGELSSIEQFAYRLSMEYDDSKEPPACFGKYDHYHWTRVAKAYLKEIKALAPPDAERVVNKALGNNKLVGLIAHLFPNTRIIHAMRDPRDVSISCFMGGFNNRMHPWTTRVEWAARAWEQSERMMQHWKDSLDIPILDVHYENLVANPEEEFPRIIDFLGLEWDDRCYEFHKTRRTVRTLSYDQVNRPLYKSSSGRHKNYEQFIEGIDFPAYTP